MKLSILRRGAALLLALILTVGIIGTLSPTASAEESVKQAIGTVTASALRLRAEPNTRSATLGTAYRGDMVVVIRREGDWYRVNFNLKEGYMHKSYLELDTRKNIKIGYARFDYTTNVRYGPGTNTGIVAQAPRRDTCFIIGFNTGWYKVRFNGRIGYVRSDLVTMLEMPYANQGSPGNTYHETPDSGDNDRPVANDSMTYAQKVRFIFNSGSVYDPRRFYSTEREAREHMVGVRIKTWDINDEGEKYTRTWILTVHENLAATVEAIFNEIYALPEKPPIHSLGCFRWETHSEHNVGLAIDMNPQENHYINPDGKVLTGDHFKPGEDPYSFPVGGSVDQIFSKYGFTRGIYWRNGYKDYMHWSFFGT